MKKLRIDRAKWTIGGCNHPTGESSLLCDRTKLMCCLGHFALEIGIPAEEILGVATPVDLGNGDLFDKYMPHFPAGWLQHQAKDWFNQAVNFNDDDYVWAAPADIRDDRRWTAEMREKALTKHFAIIGWEVEFHGELGVPDEVRDDG